MGLITGFGSLSVSATAGIYLSPGLEIEREDRSLHTPTPSEVPDDIQASGRATGRVGCE